jgi:hypothetical protein
MAPPTGIDLVNRNQHVLAFPSHGRALHARGLSIDSPPMRPEAKRRVGLVAPVVPSGAAAEAVLSAK